MMVRKECAHTNYSKIKLEKRGVKLTEYSERSVSITDDVIYSGNSYLFLSLTAVGHKVFKSGKCQAIHSFRAGAHSRLHVK